MISLKLTDISVDENTDRFLEQNFLYKDIKLDLTTGYSYSKTLHREVDIADIQAIYDLDAVKNSITTCFLTSPGQKILTPNYGIDLRRYLFQPISNDNAFFIREDIVSRLPGFEPRIIVKNVSVKVDYDEQQYEIRLTFDVPSLNAYNITTKNYLNSNGYVN